MVSACMCENEGIMCTYGKQCTYFEAFGSLSYTVRLWSSRFDSQLRLDANTDKFESRWLATWLMCENEGVMCTYGKQCTYFEALALYHILFISEALDLILSFVLMLILISPSLADWRRGWCVFCMCENEGVMCTYGKLCIFQSFWLSIIHCSSLKL